MDYGVEGMKRLLFLLLLAGVVCAECEGAYDPGDDIELGEIDERIVDAFVCGTGAYEKITGGVLAGLIIVMFLVFVFYKIVRKMLQ